MDASEGFECVHQACTYLKHTRLQHRQPPTASLTSSRWYKTTGSEALLPSDTGPMAHTVKRLPSRGQSQSQASEAESGRVTTTANTSPTCGMQPGGGQAGRS